MTSAPPAHRVDGRPVSRQAFYAVACDPRRSAVVEACAGAGKTWMLVSRVLRALLDGAEPQTILAITFTRKAAGEMRQRLAEWLAELAAPQTSDAGRVTALRERGVAEDEARRLAPTLAGLYERVLAAGRPVAILTFHAWFSQLMRAAPIELLGGLGLQPGMQLIEDIEELEPELLRRFHAALLRDDARRADHALQVRLRGRKHLRRWLLAALERRIEIELTDAAGRLGASVPDAAEIEPEFAAFDHPARALDTASWRAALADLAGALGRGGAKAREAATALVDALALHDPPARFVGAQAALVTREGTPRKLGPAEGLAEVQADLARLERAVRAHEARLEHERLCRLARVLLDEYAALKRARGLADMADLERCALELLRDGDLAAGVQQRLDTRLRHVLIDEFQDTSPLQWQALHAWLAGYAGAGGGASGQRPPTLFVVGDPKQSIYRFRGAEPRVFAAARDFAREALDAALLECDHTRRNRPELVASINAVFDSAREQGDFEGFRAHTSEHEATQAPAVLLLPRIERPAAESRVRGVAAPHWRDSLVTPRHEPEEVLREREADLVARAIRAAIDDGGLAPGDIMVLCRRREPLRWLAQSLRARHVAYAAVEDKRLLDSPEVRDLLALLDWLASPRHDLSLAQALKSPLLGAGDEDLMILVRAARAHATSWWGALQAEAGEALSSALRRARGLLAAWRAAAQRLPPHDLLDRIAAEGELHARVAAAVPAERRRAALADIDALLGQALALDGGRYATVYGFVRALRRRALKIAAPLDREAVQLLTIHGAKGLEARAVFVMDADPEPPKDETATLLIDWPVALPAPRRCAFIASESRPPPGLADAMAREQAAREREALNGLYVAMTRAREQLVFSAVQPQRPGAGPSWWQRIAAHARPWEPGVAAGDAPRTSGDIVLQLLPRLPLLARADPQPAALADAPAIRLGRALHRVLEWAAGGGVGADGFDAALAAAAREFALEPAQARTLAMHVSAILSSSACARFFDARGLRWAGNEVSVAVDGAVRRIDRLVQLTSGTWWVLDYKLAAAPQHEPLHLAQLRAYRDAIAALQPQACVRAAFINGAGALLEIDPARTGPGSPP